ncbi:MAG TPA: energy transducer TonB [Rhodocyclaceae bacterium]
MKPDVRLLGALAISLAAHSLLFLSQPGPTPAGSPGLRAQLHKATASSSATPDSAAPSIEGSKPVEPVERSYPQTPPAGSSDQAGAGDSLRPGIDLAGLRQYHAALSQVVARFYRYPPEARAAGWEGRVPLRLAISAAGLPENISLIGSSGHEALDQAALETLRMAAGHTPVPDILRGQSFSIDLAVDFNLKDAKPGSEAR